jgi:hypothetical protein
MQPLIYFMDKLLVKGGNFEIRFMWSGFISNLQGEIFGFTSLHILLL